MADIDSINLEISANELKKVLRNVETYNKMSIETLYYRKGQAVNVFTLA